MRKQSVTALLLLNTLMITAGCAGPIATTRPPSEPPATATPGSTATPPAASPTARQGVIGLVEDLSDAGVEATAADAFDGEPLAFEQVIVCAGGEDIRVFAYATEQERAATSARIDPRDPTNIGTAIVEWDGWPKFWQRDRIIVLYLGRDADTIELLTQLMGEPFAQGVSRPQRLPGGC